MAMAIDAMTMPPIIFSRLIAIRLSQHSVVIGTAARQDAWHTIHGQSRGSGLPQLKGAHDAPAGMHSAGEIEYNP
jgi:hypothetical protein